MKTTSFLYEQMYGTISIHIVVAFVRDVVVVVAIPVLFVVVNS